jgi:aflatoxin B1 aldehyde reductase
MSIASATDSVGDRMNPILGTMTFGPQVDCDTSRAMVACFLDEGYREIDTAYVYNNGDSERFLGAAVTALAATQADIATKANPRVADVFDASALSAQIEESLKRLERDAVDLLYLHFPDPRTPLETTLDACAELHAKGKFRALGLSNFPAWQVVEVWHLCERHGWPRPTVYQGLYNGLSRGIETELLPALRRHGMRFYAYNPLAGGVLAGKYAGMADEPTPGRFTFRPNYRNRYWKKSFFEALELLSNACREQDIPLVQAAYRWLMHHSGLRAAAGDGIILGASSLAQLEQNLAAMRQPPLPTSIVEAFEAAWGATRPECPAYFRTSV